VGIRMRSENATAEMNAALGAIAAEVLSCLTAHFYSYLPYLIFYFALDVAVRFGAPLLLGASYCDALLLRDPPPAAALPAARLKLHRRVSQRVVAVVMALHVSSLSLYGLLTPAISAPLQADPFHGRSPLTQHLVEVAVAYFIWDTLTCFDQGLAFLVHGVACLMVFACALVRFAGPPQPAAREPPPPRWPRTQPTPPRPFPPPFRGPFSTTWRW
jgi:predicted membrane metal-binding protein